MKLLTFKHSLVAIGVATAFGLSSQAMAATSGEKETKVTINNQAFANYKVGEQDQPKVESNIVTVEVSEQVSFSLLALNEDGKLDDDTNNGGGVVPNGFVLFEHRLRNTGNRSDNYTVNLADAEAEYNLANSTVSYQVYNADDTAVTDSGYTGTDVSVSTINNATFPLEAGQYVDFTISAKTQNNIGGDTQDMTLTATSSVLTNNTSTGDSVNTLTNTDISNTVLPVFSIVKSITDTLNLNNPNDEAEYTVTVTNDGSANYASDASDITVRDTLPAGLVLVSGSVESADANAGASVSETTDGFVYSGIDLAVNNSVTITFRVKQDTNVAPANGTINHVRVEDDLDNNSDTDNTVIDSTDASDPEQNTGRFYPANDDNENENGVTPNTPGGDSTVGLEVNQRDLSISPGTAKEIPLIGTVQYTHTITNGGNASEGGSARPINITITDPNGDTPLNVINPVYIDSNGDAIALQEVDAANGQYTLPETVTIPAGESVNIRYEVASNATIKQLDVAETNEVTVIPQGNDPSSPIDAQNTTTIKGLTLVKSQALDATCNGTADTVFDSSATPLQAEPGQCVIYQIEANNTSTTALGFDINDLVITDPVSNFTDKANYRANSATTTVTTGSSIQAGGEANNDGTNINTTIGTLAPQGTATMQFSVKIKTDRATS